MENILNKLTSLQKTFKFKNKELIINHKNCPVFNMFLGTTLYLQDFEEGCLSVNGLKKKANVGVYDNFIDDFCYDITRVKYQEYVITKREDASNVNANQICKSANKNVSVQTMQDLAIKLKKVIEKEIKKDKEICDYLNTHKSWQLIKPNSTEQLENWIKDGLWFYR